MKDLEQYRQWCQACVKCGACRATCPVFKAENLEGGVARGKITLVQAMMDGQLFAEDRLVHDLSQCLLCGSCTNLCPNQVPTAQIVAAARREVAQQKGLSGFGKGVATLLTHKTAMDWMSKSGDLASRLLCRQIPETSGLRLRFPVPGIPRERTLPKPSFKPFLKRDIRQTVSPSASPRVLFFVGCGINYLYPEIGECLVRILNFMGVHVTLTDEQGCCGLPALSAGAGDAVKILAQRNLKALKLHAFDYVLTACASCHGTLAGIYPTLGADYQPFAEKTRDVMDFLMDMDLAGRLASLPRSEERIKVTYHDPCHLRNHGLTRAPRLLLSALPQVDYVEMVDAATCCGLGGTFSIHHYETSQKIGNQKANHVAQSGAEIVATACPGCMIQLQDSLNRQNISARAVHLLELVCQALPVK
ncbi:(Fe-S)-binding protein [Desulfobacter hydrogenophilus]|uniref:Glycolate oxidase iron-sulfur subunit n=1 Tax=Desulfobacter hydrogenophilus TaxID=2291 RepID=A0A328FJG7_9BACT|nr:(Fe-S)-binding protein [Desulfobacter hydrogenophilus]NDY70574.1 (Fe-S)-binding protein [Desulfobacter hydrogenophilus]QBH13945.1 (Fe-S)-binding protein [Desulfobacter hydrogenophilus]RAM03642.1 (Fe-S)-binding protein [Desulfobacter hydrogenophilus]